MIFVSIIFKATKYEEEYHILNQLLLFQTKIVFFFNYKFYKNNHINSFNINN